MLVLNDVFKVSSLSVPSFTEIFSQYFLDSLRVTM